MGQQMPEAMIVVRRNNALRHWMLGSLGRRVSWTLVASLILPLLVLAVPQPAQAQLSRLKSVIALEFGVLPSVRASSIVGRNATDAVAIELSRSGEYDVRPRAELNQALQEQQLSLPLDINGIQRLGGAMSVDYALSGDISRVEFTSEPRRAKVTLAVRLIDVATGEFVNGSVETALSPLATSSGTDDETLVNQAINNAAFGAVKTMSERRIPEATVLIVRGTDQIRINRGVQDGIQTGMEMVVLRGRDKVGRVRINSVQAGDATATITDWGKGIKPEDKTRYVFNDPTVKISGTGDLVRTANLPEIGKYGARQGKSKSILNSVIGIVGAVMLVSFLTRTSSSNAGAAITGVTARAYSAGENTTPGDPAAVRVQLTWKPAGDVAEPNIIEYHVYRNNQLVGVLPRNIRTFTDSPQITGQTLTFNYISYAGGGPADTAAGTNTAGGTTGTTTATTTTTTGTTTNTTGTTTNTGSSAQATTLASQTVIVPALVVGVTNRYSVGVLFQRVNAFQSGTTGGTTGGVGGTTGGGGIGGTTGGGGVGGTTAGGNNTGGNTGGVQVIYQESNISAGSGAVTPMVRPTINPIGTPDIRAVQVAYQTVSGANQYAVEFASDPSFKNKVQFGPFFQTFSTSATRTEPYDLSTKFASLKAGARIYYRVGARNSLDDPGPLGKDTPNGDNYIYSQDGASFAKPDTPPAPPSGS